ncbi:hypothetical protein SSS_07229 [Sarcoptes scabiei]|uniref:Uncharacterized protein n=1 Tax=Sarcoptes scabiei TaxID=52283 RepID=A0A834RBP6_SARSC|nr:hypothetical protein SSS_07229 [Sarcoptes scabiei]
MYLNIKSSPISSVVLILSSFASLSILIEGSSDKKGSTIIINGGGSGSDEYDYGHNVQIVPVPVPAAKPKIEFYEEHIMSPSYGYDDKSMSYEGNYGHGSMKSLQNTTAMDRISMILMNRINITRT